MGEAFGIIIGEIQNLKVENQEIMQYIRSLKKRNRSLTFLAISLTAYAVVTAINYNDTCRRIDMMAKEVDELRKKGE